MAWRASRLLACAGRRAWLSPPPRAGPRWALRAALPAPAAPPAPAFAACNASQTRSEVDLFGAVGARSVLLRIERGPHTAHLSVQLGVRAPAAQAPRAAELKDWVFAPPLRAAAAAARWSDGRGLDAPCVRGIAGHWLITAEHWEHLRLATTSGGDITWRRAEARLVRRLLGAALAVLADD